MKTAIDKFNQAYFEYKLAEDQLNCEVEVAMKLIHPLLKRKRKRAEAIDSLQLLIDSLPYGYKGKRRIYELIEQHTVKPVGPWMQTPRHQKFC